MGDSLGRENCEISSVLNISEADLDNTCDAAAVLGLLQAYAADLMGVGTPLSQDVAEQLIPRLAAVDSRLVLLARIDGRPVGLAIAFQVFSTFRARPVLNLHDLTVDADFRGRGVGRQLLRQVVEYAGRMGCCRVSLEVRADNAYAQSLYRSEGFSPGQPPQEFWTKSLNEIG